MAVNGQIIFFFFSSRRRHTRLQGDWSSDVCSSDVARQREGAQGPAVKTLPERDDLRSSRVLQPRELQRRLVRLGAAVAEEDAGETGLPDEPLGEKPLRGVIEEVGDVEKVARLLPERAPQSGMGVPERVDGDTGEEIPVLAPPGVDEARAASPPRMEARSGVRAEEEAALALLDGCR